MSFVSLMENCGVVFELKLCGNREVNAAAMADTGRERVVAEGLADLLSARGFNAGTPVVTDCSKPLVFDSPKLIPCETPKEQVCPRFLSRRILFTCFHFYMYFYLSIVFAYYLKRAVSFFDHS